MKRDKNEKRGRDKERERERKREEEKVRRKKGESCMGLRLARVGPIHRV